MLVGRFGNSSGRPYISARVAIPSLGLVGSVSFLIDTGADTTLLTPADATKIGFDFNVAGKVWTAQGIGGSAKTSVFRARLVFLDRECGRLYGYENRLSILHPSDEDEDAVSERIPSLLGRDLLNNWRFTYDRVKGEVLAKVYKSDLIREL